MPTYIPRDPCKGKMAVVCYFHQQEVVTGDMVVYQVASHFRLDHKEYLDRMIDVSFCAVLRTQIHQRTRRLTINKGMKNGKWAMLLPNVFVISRATCIIIEWGFLTIHRPGRWQLYWMPFGSSMRGLNVLCQSATVDNKFVTAGVWAFHCLLFKPFSRKHY